MSLYFQIFLFRSKRFLVYPTEMLANIFKGILEIVFLIFLWTLVLKNSTSEQSIKSLISYFLIAAGISEIVMAKWGGTGKMLANLIRTGKLSNYLIKPVSIIPNLYFSELGVNMPRLVLAFVYLAVGLYLTPPTSITAIILFPVFLVASFFTALSYVVLIGCIYFYLPQASGIKNSIEHMSRILSGAWIPLTFFPENIGNIVKLLPFQVMVYAPTKALSTDTLSGGTLMQILIAYFWMVTFIVSANAVWRYSIKHYEAAGI